MKVLNKDIYINKTTLWDDEFIKVQTTGRNYDFIAIVKNKTQKPISIIFNDEVDYLCNLNIGAGDWIGLLADEEGYDTLHALANNRFYIEEE